VRVLHPHVGTEHTPVTRRRAQGYDCRLCPQAACVLSPRAHTLPLPQPHLQAEVPGLVLPTPSSFRPQRPQMLKEGPETSETHKF
jgi:hypothetical protein